MDLTSQDVSDPDQTAASYCFRKQYFVIKDKVPMAVDPTGRIPDPKKRSGSDQIRICNTVLTHIANKQILKKF